MISINTFWQSNPLRLDGTNKHLAPDKLNAVESIQVLNGSVECGVFVYCVCSEDDITIHFALDQVHNTHHLRSDECVLSRKWEKSVFKLSTKLTRCCDQRGQWTHQFGHKENGSKIKAFLRPPHPLLLSLPLFSSLFLSLAFCLSYGSSQNHLLVNWVFCYDEIG